MKIFTFYSIRLNIHTDIQPFFLCFFIRECLRMNYVTIFPNYVTNPKRDQVPLQNYFYNYLKTQKNEKN